MSGACVECGTQLDDERPFCPVCGAARVTVQPVAGATTEPEQLARTRAELPVARVQAPPRRRGLLARILGRRERPLPSFPVQGGPAPAMPVAPAAVPAPVAARPADPWAFPAAPASTGLITGVPGATPALAEDVVAPVAFEATAAAAPVSPDAAPEPAEEGWDETRLSAPEDRARLAAAPARPVALVLPDGTSFVVGGPTLVGRDPQAAEPGWALLPVRDPKRSVSKTHAALDVDGGGLWVTDRGSTNGTVVSEPGRPPRVVERGARARVPVGAALHLGELRFAVREAAREGGA